MSINEMVKAANEAENDKWASEPGYADKAIGVRQRLRGANAITDFIGLLMAENERLQAEVDRLRKPMSGITITGCAYGKCRKCDDLTCDYNRSAEAAGGE